MDTSFVDDLGRDLLKITKIGIIIIVVLALLLLAAHCLLEWYKWRCLQQHLEYTRQAWVTDPTMNNVTQQGKAPILQMTDHNLLVLAGSQQHPLLTRISNQLAGLLRLTPSQHTNLQWFFHYVFHPPVLAVFLIGALGLLSVELQLLAIHPLQEKYSSQVASSVSDFSGTIATSINASMYNQSATYADQINAQVNSTQSTINDGLFGWVNGTTTTLNDTLVTFYSDIQNAVQTVFNGTVLEDPIQEFIRCIIGTKIEAIENALTFLHDNLNIDIPRMNESALLLSQDQVDEASKPIAEAAVGDGSDGNSGIVGKIVSQYVSSLKKERIMFLIFIGLWFFVVIIAILIILWHSYVRPAILARRQKKNQINHNHTTSQSSFPLYRTDASTTYMNEKPSDVTPFNPARASKKEQEFFSDINLQSPVAARHNQDLPQMSWDKMLDSSADNAEKSQTKRVSAPRKLKAIGSKAGRERFVSDEERDRMREAEANSVESESSGSSWMKKLTGAFQRNSDENSPVSVGSNGSSTSISSGKRNRPNLTIATGKANSSFAKYSRDQLPTASRSPPAKNNPPSAWSLSPNPPVRQYPWVPNALTTAGKKPKAKPKASGLPISPRPVHSPTYTPNPHKTGHSIARSAFHRPAVPATAATTNVLPSASSTAPLNPIRSSSYDSSFPRRESLLPENTLIGHAQRSHSRAPSVPLNHLDTRDSTLRHTRHASALQNPFATPFDDEARVIPENWPMPPTGPHQGSTQAVNPFSPVAM